MLSRYIRYIKNAELSSDNDGHPDGNILSEAVPLLRPHTDDSLITMLYNQKGFRVYNQGSPVKISPLNAAAYMIVGENLKAWFSNGVLKSDYVSSVADIHPTEHDIVVSKDEWDDAAVGSCVRSGLVLVVAPKVDSQFPVKNHEDGDYGGDIQFSFGSVDDLPALV